MKKSIASIIDELSVTNIKIFHLTQKLEKKPTPEDKEKLQDLNKYRLELCRALSSSRGMKKSIATIIDELSVTNIKIFHLVEKMEKNKHTLEDAKKAHDLNRYRSSLCNNINREFKERENIKI